MSLKECTAICIRNDDDWILTQPGKFTVDGFNGGLCKDNIGNIKCVKVVSKKNTVQSLFFSKYLLPSNIIKKKKTDIKLFWFSYGIACQKPKAWSVTFNFRVSNNVICQINLLSMKYFIKFLCLNK